MSAHGTGSRFIQHHYDDAKHQFDAGKLGIWLFLAQEVLFFSALFVAYILYRIHHPEIYSYAHKWLDVKMGAINTAVLIFSSLTAAWAVRCAQKNQRAGLIGCIVVTILCACTFMGVKYKEYSHKYHEGILFGRYFDPCISPGGTELLTKKNECPGSKTTVEWDFIDDETRGKIKSGCFEEKLVDQDPKTEGVQARCTVTISKGTKKGADWVETSSTPVPLQCPEEMFGEAESASEMPAAKTAEAAHKFPCWRTASQPAVCPDLTKPDEAISGSAARPQVGVLVEFGDEVERGEDTRIIAKCDAPPKAPDAGDIFADKPTSLATGKGTIHPVHEMTTHEEHEREAAGAPPAHTNMFLSIYFAMTGLHGVHVLFGIGVFIWLLIRSIKGHFTEDYFGPIDFAALYWHIVDLIWIFLFPLLYLIH